MAIEVKNVSKSFGKTRALDKVSLTFEENKIYGLLGNNGAGKSTLLNIITGKYFADEGSVLVDGEAALDNDSALSKIYMMSEQNLYPDAMRVEAAFKFSATLYPNFDMDLAHSISDKFGLNRKSKIINLSTGYASVFRMAVAMSAGTPYVLLDEPVLGLDAQHRDMFYKLLIENYSENPRTFIISTHLISEVQNLIEHTVIIRDGIIIKDISCDELLAGGYTVSGPAAKIDEYIKGRSVICTESIGGLKTATVSGIPEAVPADLEVGALDLQGYFIDLMNGEESK